MAEIREHSEFYEVKTSVSVEKGLHARPCVDLVEILTNYDNDVWVTKEIDGELDDKYTNGKSIMEMLMLAAHFNTDIRFLFDRGPHQVSRQYVEGFVNNLENVLRNNIE